MSPEEYERQDIEVLNEVRPYCFESDREEQWFKVGLQYGLDAADKEPLIHWISVKDDLPCNHKELTPKDYTVEVLTLDNCNFYRVVRMWKFHDKWVWGLDDLPITHWMTLPELPKE